MALFLLCLFPLGAMAQSTVKGTVNDEAGEPIIGASVQVQGTKTGAITDFNGNFSVQASSNATLIVSYVGYTTEKVSVGGRNNIQITLKEDIAMLSDVVVIGYGVQKKSDLTGAVSSVKGDVIVLPPNASILTMAFTAPSSMAVTLPGNWLRALS